MNGLTAAVDLGAGDFTGLMQVEWMDSQAVVARITGTFRGGNYALLVQLA